MERFEKYLNKKLSYLNEMISIFDNSQHPESKRRVITFKIERELVLDIIHHYRLFVKGETDEN